jgi:DTW domain-containing protein YfiP
VRVSTRKQILQSSRSYASREHLIEAAKDGRVATVSAIAQALRSATQQRQAAALKAWNPAEKPDGLTRKLIAKWFNHGLPQSPFQRFYPR